MTIDQIESRLEGIENRIALIERMMNGESGKLGMYAMIQILWRSYVWVLCTLSAGIGSIATVVAYKLI